MPLDLSDSEPAFLIDGSIYIFQSHFSPHVECVDKAGNELSAVYGFTQFLLQFLRRVKPSRIAVALDESLFCGFRHQLCPKYKSNRELPDENLAMQLKACAEVSAILGLATYSSKVYEADDIIGTLAKIARRDCQHKVPIHIVSKDKDLAQLLETEEDCLWDYSSNRKRYPKDIFADFGVWPAQIPDFLGLAGDAVDCISGVPGIGPVKAVELLKSFDSIEGVYQNLDKLGELPVRGAKRLASMLQEHRDLAELSKTLATIVCEVEDSAEEFANIGFSQMKRTPISLEALEHFLIEYGFQENESRRLLTQINY